MKLCPKCGSNVLKCHHWFEEDKEWIDCGIWHKYDRIELGTYTCECGKVFSITEWNYQEIEILNQHERS